MIRFSHGVATSVGRVRRVNEDSYLAVPPIYAVADGMGGHAAGDVASRLAVEVLARCVELRPLFTEAVLHALESSSARRGRTGWGPRLPGWPDLRRRAVII